MHTNYVCIILRIEVCELRVYMRTSINYNQFMGAKLRDIPHPVMLPTEYRMWSGSGGSMVQMSLRSWWMHSSLATVWPSLTLECFFSLP